MHNVMNVAHWAPTGNNTKVLSTTHCAKLNRHVY